MKLLGKSLTLVSITRQSIFDASFACACENCGKTIVNMATVQDTDGTKYTIGLDCKKTLIDKKHIEHIQSIEPAFIAKSKIKDFKRMTKDAEKFLLLCSNPNHKIHLEGNHITIEDDKPNQHFPSVTGNSVFFESIGYLNGIGLKDFIQNLHSNGRLSTRR